MQYWPIERQYIFFLPLNYLLSCYPLLHPKQKRLYGRETIEASNYEKHHMYFISLTFYAVEVINPFLNSRISANRDKVDGVSAYGEILIPLNVSLQ